MKRQLSVLKKKSWLFWVMLSIFTIGLGLRVLGIYWDHGFHLHPDERMIVMVSEKLAFPKPFSFKILFSPQSPLNPKFFPYGSLPLYLLKFSSWLVALFFGRQWLSYANLPVLGRIISTLFDLGTIWLIFKLAERLFNRKTGALAAFFYATCVFPIQASHFYAVDVMLNFFIWATIYQLLIFYSKPGLVSAFKVGVFFGLSLATKVSATVLLSAIGTALMADLVLLGFKFWRNQNSKWWQKFWLVLKKTSQRKWSSEMVKRLFLFGGLIVVAAILTFLAFEPYALIDFATFSRQILEQRQMTADAYVFPYTLQYVGTIPYFYQIKQMVLWGAGIGLGVTSIIAFAWYLRGLIKRVFIRGDYDREAQELIIVVFALAYFLVVGCFAVKFMRYLLPLYPFLILISAKFIFSFKKKIFTKIILGLVLVFHLSWTIAFSSIYLRPHPRVEATNWINQNISEGSTLAVEHWDDRLPIFGSEKFEFVDMPMYEPDGSALKWQKVNENLEKADYLILSSNRLFTPLQKLSDCRKFKKCYPKTAEYYQDLFEGRLGFEEMAEFTSYPALGFGSLKWEINDQGADESFTVYDHPRVIIFKKTAKDIQLIAD